MACPQGILALLFSGSSSHVIISGASLSSTSSSKTFTGVGAVPPGSRKTRNNVDLFSIPQDDRYSVSWYSPVILSSFPPKSKRSSSTGTSVLLESNTNNSSIVAFCKTTRRLVVASMTPQVPLLAEQAVYFRCFCGSQAGLAHALHAPSKKQVSFASSREPQKKQKSELTPCGSHVPSLKMRWIFCLFLCLLPSQSLMLWTSASAVYVRLDEMLYDEKTSRTLANASKVFTKTFPQSPPSFHRWLGSDVMRCCK